MPIDKSMSDAMLGTFRQMVTDCKNKGYNSEAFHKMCAIMNEMEQLAVNMNDLAAFNAKLAVDGYFVNFSNEYSKVLSEAASMQYSSDVSLYDDNALLQQTLKSYEDSLKNLEGHQDKAVIQKSIQQVIDLGRSGVNYPTFLRLIIEEGLDKVMEGSILNRKYLLADIAFYEEMLYPPMERRSNAIFNKYEELSMGSAFHLPNPTVFALEQVKIIDDHDADLKKYQHVQFLWWKMFTNLHDWIDAYTKFAPTDERYKGMTPIQTQRNIDRSKNTLPGKIKIYEKQLMNNYQIAWKDIFNHESFDAEYRSNRFNYFDEYIRFIKNEVFPQCIPLKNPEISLIEKAEKLYNNSLMQQTMEERKIKRERFIA